MAVSKRKKGYYIYFRPFKTELVGVATNARCKTEARQIEMELLKACRTGDYGSLDPTTREVCVRMFQNQGWSIPDELDVTLPTSGELTLWKGIELCLTYPGIKESSNRERHEQSFLHVVRLLGKESPIKSIWIPDIEAYQMNRLDEGAAPSTVNKEKSALSMMFQVLVKLRLIEVNAVRLVKNLNEKSSEREVYLSLKDFQRTVERVPPWLRAIIQTLYFTGMRRGEVLGLTRNRVSLKERMILMRPEDVKEGKWKRVPIHHELVPVLQGAMKILSLGTDKIFLIDGQPPNEDSLRKPWVKAMNELGMKVVPHIHDLRHTWKTNAQRSGMDSEIRESIMGHWFRGKTIAERYGRVSDADLLREIDKMTFDHGATEILVSEPRKKNPERAESSLGKNVNKVDHLTESGGRGDSPTS